MDKKYISENKYRKVASSGRKKRSENISKKLRAINGTINFSEETEPRVLNTEKKKKEKRKKNRSSNKLTLVFVIISVILIFCAIRLASKKENESFFNIFGVKVQDENIEKLDIALVGNVDITDKNSKNVVLTELNNYTNGVLLRVTDKYEIEYELLNSVEKKTNSEYVLNISNNNTLTASVLKSRLSLYNNSDSKYYANCKNIQAIEEIDAKTVKITLKNSDALFIYKLQLPISFSTTNTGIYNVNTTRGASNKIAYIKKDYIDYDVPNSLSVETVKNDDEAINLFKAGMIDMFFTDSYDISEKLGKTEADIRSYLNGKCLFLFGNSKSDKFSKKEVRQAIAYSIDREKIRKEIYLNSGAIIDIPEIYSEIKYKYDIYDAQNLLLASGYTMQNSQIIKDGEYVKLTFLVNKMDETKVKVATYIKEDLESIGIDVDVRLLTSGEIEKQVQQGNYDLVLADITLNENPDISFIKEYINISSDIDEKIKEIEGLEDVQKIVEKVNELMQLMSNDVACLGIHADATYMVSKKNMNDFASIKYMNIFKNILLTK